MFILKNKKYGKLQLKFYRNTIAYSKSKLSPHWKTDRQTDRKKERKKGRKKEREQGRKEERKKPMRERKLMKERN